MPEHERHFRHMRVGFLVLLSHLLLPPLAAEVYVSADPAAALFQRDKIPIDTDTMRELSRHLTDLARREMARDPAQLRATAQLLAIAVRLDPANRPAREIDKALREEQAVDPFEGDINAPLSQAWGIAEWLVAPEAGAPGARLGHQIIDTLAVINPRSPEAKLRDPAGEAARWQNVVPPLTAYRRRPDPEKAPAPPPPPPEPPPVKRAPLLLRQASTQTPLFLYDKDLRRHLRIVPLRMQVEELPQPDLFTFSLLPTLESPDIDSARNEVRKLLEETWPHLPVGNIARISTGEERYASKNEKAISGPAALLMHAALAGRQLRPDVIFVGELTAGGGLTRPRQSWDYLRALRVAEGGRLLVPPDFEPELEAMIALENPAFFLRWEVLIVSSLEVALSLATVNGDPEGLAATSRLYAELREVSRNKDVGQLCVNAKVRERLEEIVSKAPFHYSARMLLTQGNATKRPTRVEREVAARILRSALEPLSGIIRPPLSQLSVKRLIPAGETSAAEIERFAKFISPQEGDLVKEARALAQLAETLGRAKRDGDLREGVIPGYHQSLQTRFPAFLKKLAPFTRETIREAPGPPEPAKAEKTP
ncbi:MAG: hypothetical protein MK194_07420 [Roseibacillus sp.]|nr:hypothetical protein [Roseibacillus sp.]